MPKKQKRLKQHSVDPFGPWDLGDRLIMLVLTPTMFVILFVSDLKGKIDLFINSKGDL